MLAVAPVQAGRSWGLSHGGDHHMFANARVRVRVRVRGMAPPVILPPLEIFRFSGVYFFSSSYSPSSGLRIHHPLFGPGARLRFWHDGLIGSAPYHRVDSNHQKMCPASHILTSLTTGVNVCSAEHQKRLNPHVPRIEPGGFSPQQAGVGSYHVCMVGEEDFSPFYFSVITFEKHNELEV